MRAMPESKEIKVAARKAFHEALRLGKIIRPSECSGCGKVTKVHGHHDDYARPLDVRWLCRRCHGKFHSIPKPEHAPGSVEAAAAAMGRAGRGVAKVRGDSDFYRQLVMKRWSRARQS